MSISVNFFSKLEFEHCVKYLYVSLIFLISGPDEVTQAQMKLVNSLKHFQQVYPVQYNDFNHTIRKNTLSTEVSAVSLSFF